MSQAISTIHDSEKIAFTKNVNLSDLAGSMDFFQETVIAYIHNEISERNLRAIVYAMRGYLDYLKHADDLRIEERIQAIEEAIHAKTAN